MLKILILTDKRTANTRQSTSLANGMKNIINSTIDTTLVSFNSLSKLPNFLTISKFTGKIANPPTLQYDIIISCGRRLAKMLPIAKYKFGNKHTKIITILNPNMNFSSFDAVILPKHDNIKSNSNNNIIHTNGALSNFGFDSIKNEIIQEAYIVKKFYKPYICVTIGGDSKNFTFTEKNGIDFINKINQIAKNMDGTLLITTSRRTPKHIVENIKKLLDCSHYLYDYSNQNKTKNPYIEFLFYGEYFITTGDSISMICEICSLKKAVYVYKNGIIKDKYINFLKTAVENKSVKILDSDIDILKSFKSNPIDDLNFVVKKVFNLCKIKFHSE